MSLTERVYFFQDLIEIATIAVVSIGKVKLSPFSRGRPESSLFKSYYTEV